MKRKLRKKNEHKKKTRFNMTSIDVMKKKEKNTFIRADIRP